jgi:hypothetical protein
MSPSKNPLTLSLSKGLDSEQGIVGLPGLTYNATRRCEMSDYNPMAALFSGFFAFIFWVAVYVWLALCLYVIAKKTNTPNEWLAWIPIANIYLMCKIAGKPGWWTVLFFIPIVNIVFAVIVWWGIAEARQKPGWLGLLMLVPIANLIIPGILAFAD